MPNKPNEREYRNIDIAGLETRAGETGGQYVEGYACTYNQPYLLYQTGEYRVFEQVDPEAFADADTRDVIMQYDHTGRVFARTRNGTLTLDSDEHGLKIRADLSGTEIGRQLYEEIRGGYTDKMSFGFTVAEDVTRESEGEDGKREILRTITKIRKLYDVSAVSLPTNDATEISARSLSEGVIAKAEEERLASEERMRKIEAIKAIKIGG